MKVTYDPEVDVFEVSPVPGDRYLLYSDGLFGVVGDDLIAGILGRKDATLEEICRALIDAANDRGGPDNITTLVLAIDAG